MIKWAAYIDTWGEEPLVSCEQVEVTETATQFKCARPTRATGNKTRIKKSENILFDSKRAALENLERVWANTRDDVLSRLEKIMSNYVLIARALEECE